ncbi:MAG: hypothetical protein M1825_000899 [Sarcosagium campestre]|nr:MAG: hypothetical protein M1825_000899 [Sarcosagium campestre]
MAAKKLLVVFGATGVQGGSVIKSFLSDPTTAEAFKLRAITRDPSKPSAQALAAKGVECVTGDTNSIDSLKKALVGAYAVFGVTNYWDKPDKALEIKQGKNIADAAKAAGVQHMILFTVLGSEHFVDIKAIEVTKGAFPNVYHFDSKAEIGEYMDSIGLPTTSFMPGFYMSNLQGILKKDDSGTYVFSFPGPSSTVIPLSDTKEDTGKFVKAAIKSREKTLGKSVLGASDYYTIDRILEIFKKVKPSEAKNVRFQEITGDQYKNTLIGYGMPDFVAQELLENMQFMAEFGYYGKESLDWSHQLLEEPATTLEEYFEKNF